MYAIIFPVYCPCIRVRFVQLETEKTGAGSVCEYKTKRISLLYWWGGKMHQIIQLENYM